MNENSKRVNEIIIGFSAAMFTIFYSWVLMFIPTFLLQIVFNLTTNEKLYVLAVAPFQIGLAVLGSKIAIKQVAKDISEENNKIKILISIIVIEAITLFVVELVLGTGTLLPFKNFLGFLIIMLTYIISDRIFLNRIK